VLRGRWLPQAELDSMLDSLRSGQGSLPR
jgi:hypothetical protein